MAWLCWSIMLIQLCSKEKTAKIFSLFSSRVLISSIVNVIHLDVALFHMWAFNALLKRDRLTVLYDDKVSLKLPLPSSRRVPGGTGMYFRCLSSIVSAWSPSLRCIFFTSGFSSSSLGSECWTVSITCSFLMFLVDSSSTIKQLNLSVGTTPHWIVQVVSRNNLLCQQYQFQIHRHP